MISRMSRWPSGIALAGALLLLPLGAQSPAPAASPRSLQNTDFEEGVPGLIPPGWMVPRESAEAGFRAELREGGAAKGRRCAVVLKETGTSAGFGNLKQVVDAASFRGQRIRLRAQVRRSPWKRGGGPVPWLRVDAGGGNRGFFDNMDDRPITTPAWSAAEIIGDVAPDAEALHFGLMLLGGKGRAWIDAVGVEVLGPIPMSQLEAARPLSERGLRNLTAFGRALSYVRFFHPSDEAAGADWNRVAIDGVRALESSRTPRELAGRMQAFLAPYAPTVRILELGQTAAPLPVPAEARRLVRWRHQGFGEARKGIYHSEREVAELGQRPPAWADPAKPLALDLGEGLVCALPTVLYADAQGRTLPRSPQPGKPGEAMKELPRTTAGSGAFTGDDRGTRLAGAALAWGVFQHFYPYFDVVKVLGAAGLPKARAAAARDKDGDAFTHTLRRLVAALRDGHGSVTGHDSPLHVPALSLVLVEGRPRVLRSREGTVPPGSEVLLVDGMTVEARMAELRSEISAAGEGWMEVRLAQGLLAGPKDSSLRIAFREPGGSRRETQLLRTTKVGEQPRRDLPEKIQEIRQGIWYVDLDRITGQDFDDALPKLAAAKGLVLDLRGYPSIGPSFLQHLTDKPLESARWNIPVVTQPDGHGWEWELGGRWRLKPLAPRITGRVAFLTGGGAISYAESCMGIVEAYKLAEIVGEPTAGTNGNVNPFDLPGGYRISWTGMKVLKHDGSIHHGVGILPTIPVKPTAKGLAEGRDEVLEKALEVVAR